MQPILFYHGGPGLNGNPERQLLTTPFAEAGFALHCWDEPSPLRPEGYPFRSTDAFANVLDSAEAFLLKHYEGTPLPVIGFCFGTNMAKYLALKHPDKIRHLFIITPAFLENLADINIFRHLHHDFVTHQMHEEATQMDIIIRNFSGSFDENTIAGWSLCAVNPRLFNYYWQNQDQRNRYVVHYSGAYNIDADSFFSTRGTQFHLHGVATVPTTVMYGKHDSIISIADEIAGLPEHFSDMKILEMENSAHYAHLEETDAVLRVIRGTI